MASEKKPSIYSDRGTIGSTDELDEYGVWVKSEPQDLSSAGVESQESAESSAAGMDDLPDFNIDFGEDAASDQTQDDFGIPDEEDAEKTEESGFEDSLDFDDLSIPEETPGDTGFTEVSMEDFLDEGPEALDEPANLDLDEDNSFAAPEAPKSGGGPDLSTQLLMKIAEELSSIRSELSVLKKEFSGFREHAPAGEDKAEGQKKGFFDEAEDEKIALTGDELDNILNTADFTEEAGADATEELPGAYPSSGDESPFPSDSFQVVTDGDLPDLLSEQSDIIGSGAESVSEEAAPEEEAPGDAPPENASPSLLEYEDEDQEEEDDIVIDLDFDDIDPDALPEGSPPEPAVSGDVSQELADFDISLEDTAAGEEAGEGFNAPSAASEDAGEGFALEDSDSDELRQLMQEGAQPMTAPPEDTSYLDNEPAEEDLSLDDFSLDETSLDEPSLDEPSLDEPSSDEISLDETSFNEISLDEPSLDETSLDEPSPDEPSLDEPSSDEISLDETSFSEISLDEPSLDEPSLDEPSSDEISLDETSFNEISLDEPSLDETSLDEPSPDEPLLDETSSDEISLDETSFSEISLDEPSLDETSLDEPSLDETALDEPSLDEASLDLSNAVIDEPDLSSQITENPLQEPSLDNLSLDDDDISIDMDVEERVPEDTADSPDAGGEEVEFSIPEGFVVESDESQGSPETDFGEEVFSGDDTGTPEQESEPLGPDISPAAEPEEREISAGEELDIPTGIKQELRTVLSYMDQLLESLPEEKIEEFAKSEYFDTYKKLFKELGLD
jgi:hypothetical protein